MTCVYEDARVDDEADGLDGDFGTGLGLVTDIEDVLDVGSHEFVMVDWRGDSESDPLSHASSSPQSPEWGVLNEGFSPI